MVGNVILLISSLAVINCTGLSIFVQENQRLRLFSRSLFGIVAFTAVTYWFGMAPMLDKQIILNTTPIWTVILAWVVIGEKLDNFEIFAMIASFFSILLIASLGHPKEHVEEKEKRMKGST